MYARSFEDGEASTELASTVSQFFDDSAASAQFADVAAAAASSTSLDFEFSDWESEPVKEDDSHSTFCELDAASTANPALYNVSKLVWVGVFVLFFVMAFNIDGRFLGSTRPPFLACCSGVCLHLAIFYYFFS